MSPLRRAVRALAGLDHDTLDRVTPEDMHAVLLARGWEFKGTPFPMDASQVVFTYYKHRKAKGRDRYLELPDVAVPMHPEWVDYPRRVVEWVTAVATRHGDVAPAEILGEVLALRRA